MKPDLILSAIIILILVGITWTILDTVMQSEQPICEQEGHPMPQEYCEALDEKGQGS